MEIKQSVMVFESALDVGLESFSLGICVTNGNECVCKT
jgi:hypothetical protein